MSCKSAKPFFAFSGYFCCEVFGNAHFVAHTSALTDLLTTWFTKPREWCFVSESSPCHPPTVSSCEDLKCVACEAFAHVWTLQLGFLVVKGQLIHWLWRGILCQILSVLFCSKVLGLFPASLSCSCGKSPKSISHSISTLLVRMERKRALFPCGVTALLSANWMLCSWCIVCAACFAVSFCLNEGLVFEALINDALLDSEITSKVCELLWIARHFRERWQQEATWHSHQSFVMNAGMSWGGGFWIGECLVKGHFERVRLWHVLYTCPVSKLQVFGLRFSQPAVFCCILASQYLRA